MVPDLSTESLHATAAPPQDLCGYEFLRWLKDGRTALCRSDGKRLVVLKKLDPDCLLDGDLHPDIRERLARIRELAHAQVATLISVERDTHGDVYAVWQHIEGTSFETWACDPMRDQRQAARMMRELVLAVEAMHGQGIVHGALHGGNIVIDEAGGLRLLDVSPLLFDQIGEDVAAMAKLFERVVRCRSEQDSKLGAALIQQISGGAPLRDLSASISRMIQSQDATPAGNGESHAEHRSRRRALHLAAICGIAAAALALGSWWYLSHSVAAPPEAPAEALQPR